MAPTVSVVVPAHQAAATLGACLAAVRACVPPPDELIVVDDASTDDTAAIAAAAGATVLRQPRNLGPAAARNRGAAAATGALLVLLDADVCVPPDALARAAAFLESDAAARDGVRALSAVYSADPPTRGFASRYLNHKQRAFQLAQPALADTAWTAFFMVWRETFAAAGGFDTAQRRAAADDLVLGCRIRAQGHRLAFLHSLEVDHHKETSVAGVLRFHFVHGREFARALPRHRDLLPDKPRQSSRSIGNALLGIVLVPQLGALALGPRGPAAAGIALTLGVAAAWNGDFLRTVAAAEGRRAAAASLPLLLAEGIASATGTAAGLAEQAPRRLAARLRRRIPEPA